MMNPSRKTKTNTRADQRAPNKNNKPCDQKEYPGGYGYRIIKEDWKGEAVLSVGGKMPLEHSTPRWLSLDKERCKCTPCTLYEQ